MIRLCLWLVSLLTIVSILPIALIRALPYDDSDLRAFLAPAADCSLPCFLGIRPGVTRVSDAVDLLRAHDWIDDPSMNAPGRGYGEIRWNWSGAQSRLIDTTRPARMTFYWDREDPTVARPEDSLIETISLYTHIRIHNAQAWYGDPDAGAANVRRDDLIGYIAVYYSQSSMLHLSAALPCPMNLLGFWEARTKITMSIGHIPGASVPLPALMATC